MKSCRGCRFNNGLCTINKRNKCMKETLKSKYWKDGNILITNNNGPVIISNGIGFGKGGCIHKSCMTDDLIQSEGVHSNDILAVYYPKDEFCFDPFDIKSVEAYCVRIWKRANKEMTVEEIEERLGLCSGTLRIKK